MVLIGQNVSLQHKYIEPEPNHNDQITDDYKNTKFDCDRSVKIEDSRVKGLK